MKKGPILKILAKILAKNFQQTFQQHSYINKNNESQSKFHKTFSLNKSLEKRSSIKIFLIIYSMLEGLSNDTTHNPLRSIHRLAKFDGTRKQKPSSSTIVVRHNKHIV